MAAGERRPLTFTIGAPLRRADLPGLYARVCALLSENAGATLVCDAIGARADAVTVEALARLALAASRHGCEVRLCGASSELRNLIAFVGLAEVLAAGSP